MIKIIAVPLTILYYLFFFLCLIVFHPIQWLSLKLGGYQAHKNSVAYLNFCLYKCTLILGTRIKFNNPYKIPSNAPIIFVSNHQSMNDIPPFIWKFRANHPKFVSKIELGKGIPSVSYNLRHGGSALIDRTDGKQSIRAIMELGRYIEKNNYSAVIFPEGTRSKTGVPKPFSKNGLKMLMKTAPSAYIVPVTINNSWKINKYGKFPLNIGVTLYFDVHEPIAVKSKHFEELFAQVEKTIINDIKE